MTSYAQTLFKCSDCNIVDNLAGDGSGGAIASVQATVVLNKSMVVGNQALGWGSTVDFLGLQPAGVGGALFGIESSFVLHSSIFAGNVGDVNGGAVALMDGRLAVVLSSFKSNHAGNVGGALLLVDTTCKGFKHHRAFSSSFMNNTAAIGGALAHASPACLMSQSWGLKLLVKGGQFSYNIAREQGGAVYASGSATLAFEKSDFAKNVAVRTGGALMCDFCGQANISNTIFSSNEAESGGAIMIVGLQQQSTIASSTIVGNSASVKAASKLNTAKLIPSGSGSRGAYELRGTADANSTAPLSRWPQCRDPGVGGGICITPGEGGLKLAGTIIARNKGALGGKSFAGALSHCRQLVHGGTSNVFQSGQPVHMLPNSPLHRFDLMSLMTQNL